MVRWRIVSSWGIGFVWCVATACMLAPACSLDSSGSTAISLDAGATDGDLSDGKDRDATASRCATGKPGAAEILVTTARGGYCIDALEVTQAQYNEFLNTPNGIGSVLEGQVAFCRSKKTSFFPGDGAGCSFQPLDQAAQKLPVTCVDYCDAFAYCAWAGKHLCGPTREAAQNDCSTGTPLDGSEWYLACSQDGARAYPYGATYVAGACNDGTQDAGATSSVVSCEGAYPGLFDMSGNVWEWENECSSCTEPDAADITCRVRGGGFDRADDFSCRGTDALNRRPLLGRRPDVGFRCCDTALPKAALP